MKASLLFKDIIDLKFDLEISGLVSDSRDVEVGCLFVCLSIQAAEFIPHAINRGAVAILSAKADYVGNDGCYFIIHPNPRMLYHQLACRFYGGKQPKFVAAVTGTNGKTSVADFCRQIWNCNGYSAASIGTLGVFIGETKVAESSLSTPDAAHLHQTLADLQYAATDYLCLEASSHGIQQQRLDSVAINTVAITNIFQDHFDYHHNFAKYFAAKKRLFTEFSPSVAVINLNIEQGSELLKIVQKQKYKCITYGHQNSCDIQLIEQIPDVDGQFLKIRAGLSIIYDGFCPIIGQFQADNLMCALGILLSSGVKCDNLSLDKLKSPLGRMSKAAPGVFIDYAHTPDALQKALQSLNWHHGKKSLVVFGCGGNRDQNKRSLMGKVACKYAAKVIITDDNPRNEDAAQIRDDILSGCDDKALQIADRQEAILFALNLAKKENLSVLIAGKGHETVQIFGDDKIQFNDFEVVKSKINS